MAPTMTVRGADSPGESWDRMMAAAQAGDASAYRILLAELAQWLRRYYARRLPPAMTEDAVQDVLLAIHEKRHTYDPSRPLGPWLAAIARYKWIDAIRSLKANTTAPLDDELGAPVDETAITSAWSLEKLLAMLSPAQAEVIRLVRLEGLTVKEASQATGQSVPLVKVNIHRGLKRLIALLRDGRDEQ
jgi:RNA polymerase sigma factor (sigma-70 family)